MWIFITFVLLVIFILYFLFNRYFIFKHKPCTFSGYCEERKYKNLQLKTILSDKIKAKRWINYHFGDLLNTAQTLYILNKPEDLLHLNLPDNFIVKLNTGSSFNHIHNKNLKRNQNLKYIKNIVDKIRPWLQVRYTYNFPFGFKEPQYFGHKPQLFVEEYLGQNIKEVSIFVIKGKIAFIQLYQHKKRYLTDSNLDSIKDHYLLHQPPKNPNIYQDLLLINKENMIARNPKIPSQTHDLLKYQKEQLASRFHEISTRIYQKTKINLFRLDLYLIKDSLYFGELTFTPSACRLRFTNHFDEYIYNKFINQT